MLQLIKRCPEYTLRYKEYCQKLYDNNIIYFRPTNPNKFPEKVMLDIGSIGYAVRVSEWGKGYGTEILRHGLEIAKEHTVKIGNTQMDYVSFGSGTQPLILIPGLSFNRVKGSALSLAYIYRIFAKDYKVYVFDRTDDISEGYTIKDIAKDTAQAIKEIGLSHAYVFGVSQGGMIAQYLAVDYPELVDKLV